MVDLERVKICFLAGTLARGGAERQLVYMLKALKNAGIQTQLLCLTTGEPLEDEIHKLGIPVMYVGNSRWRLIRLVRIIQQLRREPPHILQSAHFYTNLYVAIAARLLGIISIGAIRANVADEIKGSGRVGRWNLRLPTNLIANSEVARKKAVAQGIAPERIDFVQNVVEALSEKRNGDGDGEREVKILFAGRLCAQKRPDRFLRVINSIRQSRPQLKIKATIAGRGPLRQRMEELADGLGLAPGYVEFVGELADLKPLYSKSDMLMLTSDWEGTPNVLLEAMGCGLPVVATRVGGVSEIISEDTGLTVEAHDEEGLTAATLKMIDDGNLRTLLGRHGHEYVSRFHSLNALESQLTGVYKRILGG